MHTPENVIDERLKNLEAHLKQENPVLLKVVQGFRRLDKVAYRMGLLERDESYATHIPWWPLVAILGTFSAGKSTFINHYLGSRLQRTGNQAVDDKFSVICYSPAPEPQTLPGVALDSDPRFPFYQFSKEIDEVAVGEGKRIDAYLQLKTSPSERLKGKILIDSPGFDADSQRTSTLRITSHIINLSDLVLVFFDARHPEPGAMQDTLRHLVDETIRRSDSEKFLFILNQLDTAAGEDNPEDVVAAWQRALAEKGLTAGRFYTIYNPDVAVPINDPALRRRFETKRDVDLSEIRSRIQQVEIQRAYRIVTALEKTALDFEDRIVPLIRDHMARWKRRVLWGDGILFGLIVAAFGIWSVRAGHWQGLDYNPPWLATITGSPTLLYVMLLLLIAAGVGLHFWVRKLAAKGLASSLRDSEANDLFRGNIVSAFLKNVMPWRSIFRRKPAGWGRTARKQVAEVVLATDHYVQTLNDTYTDPSGSATQKPKQDIPQQANPPAAPSPAVTTVASSEQPAQASS